MLRDKALFLQVNRGSQALPSSGRWNNYARPQLKSHGSSQYIAFEIPSGRYRITVFVFHHQYAKTNSSRERVVAHRHGRRCLTICQSDSDRSTSSTNEGEKTASPERANERRQYDSDASARFGLSDGPSESSGPKFNRQPYSSLSFIPVNDPAAALPPATKIKLKQGIRRGRRAWKKITAPQAMTGAVVGAVWAVIAHKGTALAYERLDSHPLARDLPMGLTKQVNQLMLTTVTGLGGFAVVMFSISSFGLFLLSLKLLSAAKPPVP